MAGGLERGSAAWLAEQARRDLAVVSRAGRYLSDGHRSNDACLRARRYLEWRWRLDPLRLPGGQEWQDAAQYLDRSGQGAAAVVLQAAADIDGELRAVAAAWTARYAACPAGDAETALARLLTDGTVRPAGDPVPGVDGSVYQLADACPAPGYPAEVTVLVTTMTGRDLAAGFATPDAALAWLSGRSRNPGQAASGKWRPLGDPAVEHLPRVTLEEHALGWALHHAGTLPGSGAGLGDLAWSADCRREIAAALGTLTRHGEQARLPEVAAQLARRMLRAPGWAADQVGWPAGEWAQHYLGRLAATPVRETAARQAVAALTLDTPHPGSAALADLVRRYGIQPHQARTRIWPPGARPARPASEQDQRAADLYARYGPYFDRPGSFAARMRIIGPRP